MGGGPFISNAGKPAQSAHAFAGYFSPRLYSTEHAHRFVIGLQTPKHVVRRLGRTPPGDSGASQDLRNSLSDSATTTAGPMMAHARHQCRLAPRVVLPNYPHPVDSTDVCRGMREQLGSACEIDYSPFDDVGRTFARVLQCSQMVATTGVSSVTGTATVPMILLHRAHRSVASRIAISTHEDRAC